jgi:hypothetical protein
MYTVESRMTGLTESITVGVMTATLTSAGGSLRYGTWSAGVARRLAARLELLDAFELDELRLTSPVDVVLTLLRRDDAVRDERGQSAEVLRLACVDPVAVPARLDDVVPFALTHGELVLDLLCAPARFVPLVPVCAFAIAAMTKPSAITVTTWERVCAVLI